MNRHALYFEAPYRVAVHEESVGEPGQGQLLVKTLMSAVSAGTELLIYRGQVPPDTKADDTIASLQGTFSFPLKYGYAAVGEVVRADPRLEPAWIGKKVFAFNPPESCFLAAVGDVRVLPPGMAIEDAVFFPNMETAVTLVHDGKPALGEQVVVFGQGIVGLLLTSVLSRLPLASLVTVDRYALRRRASLNAGANSSIDSSSSRAVQEALSHLQGERRYDGADLAYEVSGDPEALGKAISVTGYNGRVVIGSWYGLKQMNLDLGASFHRSRIHLVNSQVSTIEPEFRGRWDKDRLRDLVWHMIGQVRPSALITHRFHLSRAEDAYKLIDEEPDKALQVLLTY